MLGIFLRILLRLMNARDEREQEVYKVIGETQLSYIIGISRKKVWKYSDGSKVCIKTSHRYTVMFSFNKYFPFPNPFSIIIVITYSLET